MLRNILEAYILGGVVSLAVLQPGLIRSGRWNGYSATAIALLWPVFWIMAVVEWWRDQ